MWLVGVMTTSWPCRAAAIPPFTPRHDITVACGASPPSRISSQPIRRRPLLEQERLDTPDELALQLVLVGQALAPG